MAVPSTLAATCSVRGAQSSMLPRIDCANTSACASRLVAPLITTASVAAITAWVTLCWLSISEQNACAPTAASVGVAIEAASTIAWSISGTRALTSPSVLVIVSAAMR